jgi:hypothetical protein
VICCDLASSHVAKKRPSHASPFRRLGKRTFTPVAEA